MSAPKKRNVYFFSYNLKNIDSGSEASFSQLKDVLNWASELDYPSRKWTKSVNPTHTLHLEVLQTKSDNNKQLGVIVSLKERERPDVVKIPTGKKKEKPKRS